MPEKARWRVASPAGTGSAKVRVTRSSSASRVIEEGATVPVSPLALALPAPSVGVGAAESMVRLARVKAKSGPGSATVTSMDPPPANVAAARSGTRVRRYQLGTTVYGRRYVVGSSSV